jgi:Pvc16 N-terminal domain
MQDMAGYRALAAVGRSVVALLNRRFAEEIPSGRRPDAVLAGTTDFDLVNSSPSAVIRYPSVSVYCYRLSVDRETRPGWSAVASRDGIPRLPLRMHLLLSAWDQFAESELEWLGLTARILETESILTGPLLDFTGDWEPGDHVELVPDDVALDSMSEAFQALTTDYRLCLPYIAQVIRIDGTPQGTRSRVATVAAGVSGAT